LEAIEESGLIFGHASPWNAFPEIGCDPLTLTPRGDKNARSKTGLNHLNLLHTNHPMDVALMLFALIGSFRVLDAMVLEVL
jgi:hypothetical protein